MVHGGLLPDLICQPIHHNCKQERDQSRTLMQFYNNLETLCRTYLAPPLCLSTLVHVLYHFHILLCHSRFPHTMPYVFSWHSVIRFLKIHKHAVKLRLPFSVFLLRLVPAWSLTDVHEQAQCVLYLFCFVSFIQLSWSSCHYKCMHKVHSFCILYVMQEYHLVSTNS